MAEARARREEERVRLRAIVPESVLLRDRVRWGPIWAGIVIALAVQVVLTATAAAIGLISVNVSDIQAVQALSTALGAWTAISAIVSLFVGGYVAGRLMPVDTRGIGAIHGVAVWALTLVIGTLFTFIIAGTLAAVFGSAAAAAGIDVRLDPAALDTSARLIASSLGWFVLWALLALGAAVLGGYLGMAGNQTSGGDVP